MEYIISGCFGLILGSFLNVCIYRLPREESLVRPRSRCPGCGAQIRWYDNVPVLSFLLLGAKCRDCKHPISWRYPLVELLCAVIAILFMSRSIGSPLWLAVSLTAAYGLVTLSFIDIDTMMIPDEISIGLAVLGLAFFWVNPNFSGGLWARFFQSLGGAAGGFFLMWG